jgi:hypothetical protein
MVPSLMHTWPRGLAKAYPPACCPAAQPCHLCALLRQFSAHGGVVSLQACYLDLHLLNHAAVLHEG